MAWRIDTSERVEMFTPIAFRLLDDFTGLAPIGSSQYFLDLSDGVGGWLPLTQQPRRSARGILAYPRLDRRLEVIGAPPRHYRFRLTADLYRPFYLANLDGIEFDSFPYNDVEPPAAFAAVTTDVVLTPAAQYPYPAHVPVLRGVVEDAAGERVRDVIVTEGIRERVLTDERGEFALPLRWVPENTPTPIDAEDQRTGRTGTIMIAIPAALGISQTITIT
ncbi:MAG: hypothetical protein ACRD8O_04220 [Bryobacteraceae bacterium]